MTTKSAGVPDARVDQLWATLDTRKQGHLDLPALKKGLRKLDHRMCGLIKYDEFTKTALQL